MKTRNRRHQAKSGLELVEEAIHLLRMAGGAKLACYFFGTLPFVLAVLFFWADMSRNPFAREHLSAASLGLALLFLWMKFWQAVFAGQMRAQAAGTAPPRWGIRRCARALVIQAALQPSTAIVLTLATVTIFPFAWTYAFYQNVTALGTGDTPEVKGIFKQSWKQCCLWPAQNLGALFLLFGLGFFVFMNLCTVCLALPQLLKMLLGVDSIYAQSWQAMLNTTFFAAMFGLTYLCLDPIVKTVYVLRCFYGEAITSGEDLKAELKQFLATGKPALALVMLLAGLFAAPSAHAADASPAPPPASEPGVSAPQLNRAIEDVIHQSKYTWRMPRENAPDDDDTGSTWFSRFVDGALKMVERTLKSFFDWLDRLISKFLPRRPALRGGPSSIDWGEAIKHLLILLLVIVICGLAILLFRVWQKNHRPRVSTAVDAVPIVPDLADENTGAEQLPEDGWIKIGRDLLERGDFRLALRAFYFASLAHLAARGLITVAKFKSNREYERELRRRGHSLPELLTTFGNNVLVFDRTWYGLHEVNRELVTEFIANVERIKAA